MGKKLDVEYVYAGALLHDDQVVHSYIRVKPDGTLGDACVYVKPLSKHKVGSVLQFTAIDEPDNLLPGSVKFKRLHSEGGQVREWTAMSEAILVSEAAYVKAVGKSSTEFEVLEPLRDAYSKLKGRERAVLLAQISAYIAGEE